MASLGGIDAYMEQWLKTATKGNVRFTMAFLTNRMHLHCDVCNVGMTTRQRLTSLRCLRCGDLWVRCLRCGVQMKPVTADFKDLPAKDVSLGMKSGSQTQVFDANTGKPVIDEKPQNAAIIQQQMQKYDASQLTDYQLAKKIAELQLGDKKKAQEMVGQMQSEVDELFEQSKFDDAAKLNEALKAKKAQLQQLELQEVQAKILWAKSQIKQVPIVVEHVPAKPVSAPLTDVFEDKGRKFR
jgi:predicted RNA-binding Zn-ribbon protein involved in translation (DUF1610 family)